LNSHEPVILNLMLLCCCRWLSTGKPERVRL
jgi:hypothetical protein